MTRASDNPNATETANKIWNLNVGESINILDLPNPISRNKAWAGLSQLCSRVLT